MMLDKLRGDFVCDKEIVDRYEKIEKEILPFLKKRSRRLSSTIPDIDYEDALQEGRIAIIVALKYIDFEKSGGKIGPYVWKVVRNAYYGMAYEALTKSKVPYVNDIDADGNVIKRPCFPLSLDTMICTDDGVYQSFDPPDKNSVDPEREEMNRKMRTEVGRFTMKMYNRLDGVDFYVF
jgi:hypothetical protein